MVNAMVNGMRQHTKARCGHGAAKVTLGGRTDTGEPAEVEGNHPMRHAKWRWILGVAALTWGLATGARAITVDPTQIANDAAIDTPGQIVHCDTVVPTRDFG